MINVHRYWVYIMSNRTRTVLYIGVTNDLYRRYVEHKTGVIEGFTKKYRCHYLIYYEEYKFIEDAIKREKELKGWNRAKKENLIASVNPQKKDLAEEMEWFD
ncbi:MAG: GIY-YIG nuclease family protein [Bacteroidaceae bacterium]|nr:GIY-YIG nuclease family protein [Bacteroidaceae bacterium]